MSCFTSWMIPDAARCFDVRAGEYQNIKIVVSRHVTRTNELFVCSGSFCELVQALLLLTTKFLKEAQLEGNSDGDISGRV